MTVAVGLVTVSSGCAVLTGSATVPSGSATVAPATGASGSPLPVIAVGTPAPRTAAPALKTAGVAWPAILASLTGYGQWLLANPNPALVGSIAMPGCAMYNLIYQQTDGLLRDGAYVKPVPPVFGAVTGPTLTPGMTVAALGGRAVLDVQVSRLREPVVTRSGTPISAFDALAPTMVQITLMQGPDTKWRFCTVESMSDLGAPDDPSVPLL